MKFKLSLAVFSLAVTATFAGAADQPLYLNPQQPIDKRIDDLLSRMTLEEKISQISDDWGCAAIPRLKVPALLKTEGLHGHSYGVGSTIFPHAIAMAASFDVPLVNQVGKATAQEAKAAGVRQSWSPVLDVARDARWGRVEETYGEDTYLVSRMGVSWIEGFQGEGMIATPKHFAAHGGPEGGRDSNDVGYANRVMREVFLPPFRLAVEEAHAGAVMAAYGVWNGVPDNASKTLLETILRQEWGFNGFVVTDCGSIEHFVMKHSIAPDFQQASLLGLEAGVNVECGPIWKKNIAAAVENGIVNESLVDQAIRPVLAAKFRLGLFENPGPAHMVNEKRPDWDTAEHRAIARQLATESMVLVKNDNKLLPLSKDVKTIAVIGANAASVQTGDYSAKPVDGQLISVLDGIKARVSAGTKVIYAPGFSWDNLDDKSLFNEAIEAAKQADVVVMVMGDHSSQEVSKDKTKKQVESTTGENKDGATLQMPGVQGDLIKAVQAVGKPVVLTVVNGKPFVLKWEAENIPAILITWYAGEEAGNATADLLFGDKNPSGKLPITFPRSVGQLPLNYDFKTSGRSYDYYDELFAPLFRFGYGLSYTTFEYSNLVITPDANDPASVTVKADVKNTGSVAGDEVAQLYITDVMASVTTPVIHLKGFQRLSLNPGETKTATFHLKPHDLSLLDTNDVRVVEPGVFRIHVGGASPDLPRRGAKDLRTKGENLKKEIGFTKSTDGISGEFNEPKAYAAKFVYSIKAPATAQAGVEVPVTVTVKNVGNLTDITAADLYRGTKLDTWSFEIEPGQSKSHTFNVPFYTAGAGFLTVVGGGQIFTQPFSVSKSPAKLSLKSPQTQVDADGNVVISTKATDVGTEPYQGEVALVIDGKKVAAEPVQLAPGESRNVSLKFPAEKSGNVRYQLGNLPVANFAVPGGIGMAWGSGPALAIPFNETSGSSAKDLISGKSFSFQGTPQWKDGGVFITGGAFLPIAGIDLANKSFTLAANLKIAAGTNKLGIFGGHAPMGAGQDESGSKLHVGVQDGKLRFGFLGRDVSGQMPVPTDKWVNATFTYDVTANIGTIYLNTNQDAQKPQKPYEGALETIGTTPMMQNGTFTLKDVTVLNGTLPKNAVKALAEKGLDALKSGSFTTDWRTVSGTPGGLVAWAEAPAGSEIDATVEIGDGTGKVVDSKKVKLTNGRNAVSLSGLKAGTQARVRIEIAVTKWDAAPSVDGLNLVGKDFEVRWVTSDQLKKGNATGGVSAQ
ncbi:MAG TPA: glycoside hydrolase family 3 N-terminal domain-containing protein [Chthoniobacterales bacterium]|nr:glycoside hydrolase family 3 N-terminal domain-containing protein [Chthoniobacterales bacterium]